MHFHTIKESRKTEKLMRPKREKNYATNCTVEHLSFCNEINLPISSSRQRKAFSPSFFLGGGEGQEWRKNLPTAE